MEKEEKLSNDAIKWRNATIVMMVTSSIIILIFVLGGMIEYKFTPNPIKELKEDIQLCKDYCEDLQKDNANITACRFEYQTEITNIEHEEWELFHCRVYYNNGRIYGKFVGDFEE